MRVLAGLFGALVVLFLLAPLLVLVPMSLGSADIAEFPPRTLSLAQYRKFLDSRPWLESVATSLRVALVTSVVATTFALTAALLVASGSVCIALDSALLRRSAGCAA